MKKKDKQHIKQAQQQELLKMVSETRKQLEMLRLNRKQSGKNIREGKSLRNKLAVLLTQLTVISLHQPKEKS